MFSAKLHTMYVQGLLHRLNSRNTWLLLCRDMYIVCIYMYMYVHVYIHVYVLYMYMCT